MAQHDYAIFNDPVFKARLQQAFEELASAQAYLSTVHYTERRNGQLLWLQADGSREVIHPGIQQ